MLKILKAERPADKVYLIDVEALRVTRACEPGEFVIVKMGEVGERIPLIICNYDRETGATTIVFQIMRASTQRMAELQTGDALQDVMGPLSNPSEFVPEDAEVLENKKMLSVAGDVGTASVYPQARWLHEYGIDADVITDAKNHDLFTLKEQMRAVADNLYITTDNGSYVRKGMVTEVIKDLVQKQGKQYDVCIVVDPIIVMKFVCLLTEELNLLTIVSMNPIMMDRTGMCGAYRLTAGDEVEFACMGGPKFDGHPVNFDEAMKRQQMYKTQGGQAMLELQEGDTHHGGYGHCEGNE